MVLDPTLRWKTNDENPDKLANEEKNTIDEPTISVLQDHYQISNFRNRIELK